MLESIPRKSDALRRALFLCGENHHESRFCEELFNSLARAEGQNWLAFSRAVLPAPAQRTDSPMSPHAVEYLRELGVAPVNHLRLPLTVTEFDVQMSYIVIALGREWSAHVRGRWPDYASQIELWDLNGYGEANSRAMLETLRRDVAGLAAALWSRRAWSRRPPAPVRRPHPTL